MIFVLITLKTLNSELVDSSPSYQKLENTDVNCEVVVFFSPKKICNFLILKKSEYSVDKKEVWFKSG